MAENADARRLKWAIAGWGVGGRVFHAPLIRSAVAFDLVAVISTNAGRAADAAARGLAVAPSLEALVDLGVVGVTIATPAATHAPLAHAALDAGLHVVVDKPFALTAREAEGIVAHSRTARGVLSTFQNRRWDGDYLTIASVIRGNHLGRVIRVISRIERFEPVLPRWMRDTPPEQGGGVLVDLGPHLIDQLVHLLGPAESVHAELTTTDPGRVSEDDAVLHLRHRSGALSTIVASVRAATQGPRFQVNGTKAGILIGGFDVQESQLLGDDSPASLARGWGQEPESRQAELHISNDTRRIPLQRGRWDTYYPALAAAITDGTAVPVNPFDSIHVSRIIDAARLSALESRRVPVPHAGSSGL